MEFYFTNLAADIFLPKMVAGLLSHPKRQFHPSQNDRYHFTFIMKIPVDNLLTKMPAELPSTEQIFTETSRLVLLTVSSSDDLTTELLSYRRLVGH